MGKVILKGHATRVRKSRELRFVIHNCRLPDGVPSSPYKDTRREDMCPILNDNYMDEELPERVDDLQKFERNVDNITVEIVIRQTRFPRRG